MNIKISIGVITLFLTLIVTLAYSSSWTGRVVAVAINDTITMMREDNILSDKPTDHQPGRLPGCLDPREVSP